MNRCRVLLVGSMMIAISACSSAKSETAPALTALKESTTTTSIAASTSAGPEPSVSTTVDTEGEVLEAYFAFNDAFEVARSTYDPEHPLLDEFVADPLRERLRESFGESRVAGDVAGGEYLVGETMVLFEEPEMARVTACTHDLTTRHSAAGELLSAPGEAPDLFYSLLRRGDDQKWRVFEEGYVNGTPTVCEL